MKVLFLPNFPKKEDNETIEKIHNLLLSNFNIVFYLAEDEWFSFFCNNENLVVLQKIIQENNFDKSQILCVAPGCAFLEVGNIHGQSHFVIDNIPNNKAVAGNYAFDFINSVVRFYQDKKITIENMLILLENELTLKKRYLNRNYNSILYKLNGVDFEKEIKNFKKNSKIPCIQADDGKTWDQYLDLAKEQVSIKGKSIHMELNDEFLKESHLKSNVSVLFTDRDGTFLNVHNQGVNYEPQNFQYLKQFLEMGNLVVIITGDHQQKLFLERGKQYLWNMLEPYKNNIVGFSAGKAGRTLGDIGLDFGYNGIDKNGIVSNIVEYLKIHGYEINSIFAIGDGVKDYNFICEVGLNFRGIGAHIRKEKSFFIPKDYSYSEEQLNYIDNHSVESFSDFMENQVFSTLEYPKVKIYK